jgi:hypothetical protein
VTGVSSIKVAKENGSIFEMKQVFSSVLFGFFVHGRYHVWSTNEQFEKVVSSVIRDARNPRFRDCALRFFDDHTVVEEEKEGWRKWLVQNIQEGESVISSHVLHILCATDIPLTLPFLEVRPRFELGVIADLESRDLFFWEKNTPFGLHFAHCVKVEQANLTQWSAVAKVCGLPLPKEVLSECCIELERAGYEFVGWLSRPVGGVGFAHVIVRSELKRAIARVQVDLHIAQRELCIAQLLLNNDLCGMQRVVQIHAPNVFILEDARCTVAALLKEMSWVRESERLSLARMRRSSRWLHHVLDGMEQLSSCGFVLSALDMSSLLVSSSDEGNVGIANFESMVSQTFHSSNTFDVFLSFLRELFSWASSTSYFLPEIQDGVNLFCLWAQSPEATHSFTLFKENFGRFLDDSLRRSAERLDVGRNWKWSPGWYRLSSDEWCCGEMVSPTELYRRLHFEPLRYIFTSHDYENRGTTCLGARSSQRLSSLENYGTDLPARTFNELNQRVALSDTQGDVALVVPLDRLNVLRQRFPWLRVRSNESLAWDYKNFRQYDAIIDLLPCTEDQHPDREYFFGLGSLDEPKLHPRNVDIVVNCNISSHAYRLFGALAARKWSEANDSFSDIFRRYEDEPCLRKRHDFRTALDKMCDRRQALALPDVVIVPSRLRTEGAYRFPLSWMRDEVGWYWKHLDEVRVCSQAMLEGCKWTDWIPAGAEHPQFLCLDVSEGDMPSGLEMKLEDAIHHVLPASPQMMVQWLQEGLLQNGSIVVIDRKVNKYGQFCVPFFRDSNEEMVYRSGACKVVFVCDHSSSNSPFYARTYHTWLRLNHPESPQLVYVLQGGMGAMRRHASKHLSVVSSFFKFY